MKRRTLVLAILFLSAALGFAESSTVTLQNQEPATFWFSVDPKELSDVAIGSRQLAEKVAAFFMEDTGSFPFRPLAPDSQLTLEGLTEGPHLLVGFFDVEGASELPVRAFAVQVYAGSGDRFYALFSGPALLSVPREGGRLANLGKAMAPAEAAPAAEEVAAAEVAAVEPAAVEPAQAEAASAELALAEQAPAEQALAEQAEAAPPLEAVAAAEAAAPVEPAPIASFSPTYSPVVFTRESRGGFVVLPISQSRYWEEPGTRLDTLNGSIADGVLRLSIRTASGFSRDVSYFFYLFAARTLGKENALTIELLPLAREGQGACVLWKKNAGSGQPAAAPQIIGSVSVSADVCDVEISLDTLPEGVMADLGENPSIDLCSCRYDSPSAVFEEFYYTTLQLADFGSPTGGPSTR
jgi:hypothetical protein